MSFEINTLADTVLSANTGLDAIKRAPIVDKDTGIKCLRIQDISQNKPINEWGNTTVLEKDFKNFQLQKNDILIARTGASIGVSRIIKKQENSVFNNGLIRLRINKEFDSDYVYYLLKSNSFNNHLEAIAHSTATQPNMKINDLLRFEFPKLALQEQKRVAKIFRDLDDKITLNRQINQTLEAMAQALFKSWFVDFEPVKAKLSALAVGGSADDANLAAMSAISGKTTEQLLTLKTSNPDQYQQLYTTADLFPSEMVDSELGEIPKGWEVKAFGDVSICYDSKRIPLSKQQRELRQGNIPYYGATSVMDYVDEAIFDGVYLLLGEDGSVLKEDRTPFIQYIWGKSWVNNHAHVLQGKNSVSTEQLMLFISSQNITAYITGAVQLKLNQKNMNSIPMIVATSNVNDSFYAIIKPLFEQYRKLSEESIQLQQVRDSLLPKLLSGELL